MFLLNTLSIIWETIFPVDLLTGTKRPPTFSTNLLDNTDKTKQYYNQQQHKHLTNAKLCSYALGKANKAEDW